MNKVSWTARKALIRDTIVVLSTMLIIASFIFVVDIFWGWLLSRELVGVLPKSTQYYYVEIQKLPEDKREDVTKILTEDRIGYPEEEARKLLEKAPIEWEEGKSEPVRVRSLAQGADRPERKEDGFDGSYADRLVSRLKEAGVEARKVLTKDQQAKLAW